MFGQTMKLYTAAVLTALRETNSRVVRLSSYLQTWLEVFSAWATDRLYTDPHMLDLAHFPT